MKPGKTGSEGAPAAHEWLREALVALESGIFHVSLPNRSFRGGGAQVIL